MQPTPTVPASQEAKPAPQAAALPPVPAEEPTPAIPPAVIEGPKKTAPEVKTLDLTTGTETRSGAIRPEVRPTHS